MPFHETKNLSISTLTNVQLFLNTLSKMNTNEFKIIHFIYALHANIFFFIRNDVRHVQYYGLTLGLLTIVFTQQGKRVELILNVRYVRQIEL